MKKNWILVLLLLIGITMQGQSFQTTQYGAELKSLNDLNEVCPPSDKGGGMGFQGMEEISPASAEQIVNTMLSDMGISNKYNLRECKELSKNNARAQAFIKDGKIKKYIVYDIDFLNDIANSAETNYAAMFVLAHEVGHHMNDHTLNSSSSEIPLEIEADYFAGTKLAISKVNLEQTLRAVRTVKDIYTSKSRFATHPGRMDRMKAAYNGWMNYAKNDSLFLEKNKVYIAAYKREIEGYKNNLNDNTEVKPVVIQQKGSQKEVDSQEVEIEKPIVTAEETRKKKEQDAASTVLQNYFKALGGMAKVTAIKAMSFQELTETENYDYNYQYDQRSPTLLVISNNNPGYEGEQFKISNDSLYFRYEKDENWELGVPDGEENKDPKEFIKRVGSSTGNFLEDFTLFSSPSLVALKEVVTFEGEQCHRLEVKEILDDEKIDRKGTGYRALVKQNRYYRQSDGLLHATERILKLQDFKKNKPSGRRTLRTVTVHKDYSQVDGVKFPMTYKIISSTIEGGEEYVDGEITKTVSNIEITQRVK